MNFYFEVLRYEFEDGPDSRLPEIAIRGLSEGRDSKHLRILASCDGANVSSSELRAFYGRMLDELGITIPSRREIALLFIEAALERIVAGSGDAYEEARYIARLYNSVTEARTGEYVGSEMGIELLYGLQDTIDELRTSDHDWDPRRTNEELEYEVIAELKEEAARLLREKPWRAVSGGTTNAGDDRKTEIERVDQAVASIRAAFPHLVVDVDRSDPYVTAADIRQQPGLDFDVGINLQNADELHLTAGTLWVSWFPCGDEEIFDRFMKAVIGVLSGEFRIVESYVLGKAVTAELQRPGSNGGWDAVTGSANLGCLIPLPPKRRIVQNTAGGGAAG